MDKVINLGLLRHPANWIIVYLMAVSAMLAVRYIMPVQPAQSSQ